MFMRGCEGCINISLLVWVNIWLVGLMGGVGGDGVTRLIVEQVGHLGVEIGEEGGGFIEALAQELVAGLQALVFVAYGVDGGAEGVNGIGGCEDVGTDLHHLLLRLVEMACDVFDGNLSLSVL